VTRNADAFAAHFSERWDGDVPFPAAHFYYDGVVLLAMGLQYARATTGALPSSAIDLHQIILDLNAPGRDAASWADLGTAMARLGAGQKVRYVGAAAEYDFDQYGAAQYTIMDGWTINGTEFVDLGPVSADCPTVF
jgi:neutral amino acid transport system substrate-binding protein